MTRGPPMTLRNMRSLGVRAVRVDCESCGRSAELVVDQFSDDVHVPDVALKLRCRCGSKAVSTRPAWRKMQKPFNGT